MLNEYHKKAAMKQFQLINKKAYPIIRCKAENAIEESTRYIKTNYPSSGYYLL